jgi:hypothetical protein
VGLSKQLRKEGLPAVHRWRYLLVGATDEDSAKALAERIRNEAPTGNQVKVEGTWAAVYAERAPNPFAVLGEGSPVESRGDRANVGRPRGEYACGVIEWKQVPWPLWIYSVAMLLAAISIEVTVHGRVPAKVLFAAVMLGWLYFLLKGVRWVWIITIGICVLGLVPDLISDSLAWDGVALTLIGPMLLLLPVTRRHFSSHTAVMGT